MTLDWASCAIGYATGWLTVVGLTWVLFRVRRGGT